MVHLKSLYRPVEDFEPVNIQDFCLNRRPAEQPDHVFHIDATTGKQRTWREFRTRVSQAMTALGSSQGLDLRPENGEIVGVLSPNAMDYITILFALWGLTVPVCPLSSYSTVGELQHLLKDSTATRLFVHPSLLKLARHAASKVGLLDDKIYILEGSAPGKKSLGDMIDDVVARKIPLEPSRPVQRNTLAYLLFSSGTSGVPKSCMVSHYNLVYQQYQNAIVAEELDKVMPKPLPNAPTPVTLGFLPLHHTFGIGYSVIRPTQLPVTVIVMPKWDVNLALDLIPKYRIRRIPLIPSVILQILDAQKKRQVDLSSLMWLGSGAAYLPEQVRARLAEQLDPNAYVGQGWGMSECTLTATTTCPAGVMEGKTKHVPGSVGILWPSLEAKILREDGSHAELGEPGEFYLRGPSVALGYWRNERATKDTFLPGGWLRTGDQFKADEHGNLFFVDRLKDTLKISGMQVAPTEIEDTILAESNKLVSDVAVAGVSGGRTGDERIPRAWIVLSDAGKRRGVEETIKVIDVHVKESLSKYKHLRGGIEVIDAIPRNPTGKVLRRQLTDQFEARQPVKAKL